MVWIVPAAQMPGLAPDTGPSSTAGGAFARGAIGAALPTAGGFAGAEALGAAGAEGGGLVGGPVGALVGGVGGGLIGALAGGNLLAAAQNKVLEAAPQVANFLGQSDEQKQADESQHPLASFIGGLAPQALALRPGGAAVDLLTGGGGGRLAAAAKLGAGAALQGGVEAGQEYYNTGQVDPTKVALSAGAGALLNEKWGLGKTLDGAFGHAAAAGDGGLAGAADSTDEQLALPNYYDPASSHPAAATPLQPLAIEDKVGQTPMDMGQGPQPLALPNPDAVQDAQFEDVPGVGQGPNRAPPSPPLQLTDQTQPLGVPPTTPPQITGPAPEPTYDVGQGPNRTPPADQAPVAAITDQRPGVAPIQYGTEDGQLAPQKTQDMSFTVSDIAKRLNADNATKTGQPSAPSAFTLKLATQLSKHFNSLDVDGATALVDKHLENATDGSDSYSATQRNNVAAAIDEVAAFKKQYGAILPQGEMQAHVDNAFAQPIVPGARVGAPEPPVDPSQAGTRGPIAPIENIPANDAAAYSIQKTADAHAAYEQGHRDALLSGVLDNPESHSPTASFLSVLRSKGHDDTIRPHEGDRIARFEQAKQAFEEADKPAPYHGTGDFAADRDAALENEYGHEPQAAQAPEGEGEQPAPGEQQAQEPQADVPAAGEGLESPPAEKAGDAIAPEPAPKPVAEPAPPAPRVSEKAAPDGGPRATAMTKEALEAKISRAFDDKLLTVDETNKLNKLNESRGERENRNDLNDMVNERMAANDRPRPAELPPVDKAKPSYANQRARLDALKGSLDPKVHAHLSKLMDDQVLSPQALKVRLDAASMGSGLKQVAPTRRGFIAGAAASPLAARAEPRTAIPPKGFEAIARGGDANRAVSWLAANAKSPILRAVAEKMKIGGMGDTKIRVVDTSDPNAATRDLEKLDGALGVTTPSKGEILLANRPGSEDNGLNEETLTHELVHAYVAARYRELGLYTDGNRRMAGATAPKAGDAAVAQWQSMWQQLSDTLRGQYKDLSDSKTWADQIASSPDEALAWIMTHQEAQDFLKTIDLDGSKVEDPNGTSVWSRFVNWVRGILGMGKSVPDSALSKMLDAGNAVIQHGALDKPDYDYAQRIQKVGEQTGQLSADGLQRKTMTPEEKAEAGARATPTDILDSSGGKVRRVALKLTTMHQIAETYRNTPIGALLDQWADNLNKAVATKDTFIAQGAHVHEGWKALPQAHQEAVGDALIKSTMSGADLRRTGGDILKGASPAEEAAAKKVYGDVIDHFAHQRDQFIAFMSRTINESDASPAEKKASIDALQKRLGKQVYFPLMRFGDHINIATNAEYERTGSALDSAAAHLKAANDTSGISAEDLKAAQEAYTKASAAHDASSAQNRLVTAHESREDQLATRRDLEVQGYKVTSIKAAEFQPHLHAPSTAFTAKFDAMLAADTAAHADREEGNKGLSLMMHQLANSMMPEGSALRNSLLRKNVAGYSKDAMRVFSVGSRRNSGFLAALENGEKQRQILAELDTKIKTLQTPGSDTTKLTDIRNQVNKHYNVLSNYAKTPLQSFLSNMTYAYMLGGSPSFMVMHLMQTPMVSAPMLSAHFNPARVGSELTKAFGEVSSHLGDLKEGNEGTFGKNAFEQALIKYATERSVIQSTHSDQFLAAGENQSAIGKVGDRVMAAASFLPHYTEKLNRMGTMLAAGRMALDSPKIGKMLSDERYASLVKDSPWLANHTRAEVAAMRYASQVTLDSHVDYSRENAPYLFQQHGALPTKLVFQFQKYQQAMLYSLVHNGMDAFDKNLSGEERAAAGKTLMGIVGTHALLTGAMGLPGYGVAALALNAYHKMFGDKDQPFNADDAFHELLDRSLGKDAGDMVGRGLLYAPGVKNVLPADITERLGMGDLLASPKALGSGPTDRDAVATYIGTTLGGPAASLLGQFVEANTEHAQGDDWKAAELLMPKVLRDISKTTRFALQGVTTSSNNPVVKPGDLGAPDLIAQAMGFTPQKVESAYANKASVMDAKAELDARRKILLKEYTDAATADGGDTSKIRDKIDAFNAERMANGDRAIEGINASSMMRSVQQRRLASLRLNNGLAMAPKQRALVNEYGTIDPNAPTQ